MLFKILNKIKKLLFGKYLERKLIMIGLSHIANMRKDYKNIKNINNLDYKVFSQFGEDGIIDYLINSLGISTPKFVEIGVGDYSECNTRFLYETTQPNGLIIDCIEDFKKKVLKNIILWKGDLRILNENINSKNINEILHKERFDNDLDFFSLDIDGIDYWVLKELPENFSKIVVVEYNSTFGPDLEITVPNINNFDRSKYHHSNLCFGASLKAMIKLLEKKNFVFVGSTISKINAFFISKNEIDKINLKLPNINDLSEFTNSNISESRDIKGQLNFLKGKNKLNEISKCEVIDLKDDKVKKIEEIYKINLVK
tara:strand:- start:1384 stop:2322 length:939 start_codon:yes stop_codon:yes gene_type:complete